LTKSTCEEEQNRECEHQEELNQQSRGRGKNRGNGEQKGRGRVLRRGRGGRGRGRAQQNEESPQVSTNDLEDKRTYTPEIDLLLLQEYQRTGANYAKILQNLQNSKHILESPFSKEYDGGTKSD